MAERILHWWRLELDAKGKVVSCIQVERAEESGTHWLYVQARDQKQAGRRAWNLYCREVQRVRRERLVAEGKCKWCGRKNDRAAHKRCSTCRARDVSYGARARAKALGQAVPALDKRDAIAARAAEHDATIRDAAVRETRLETLLRVRAGWRAANAMRSFAEWLQAELVAAGFEPRTEAESA